MNRTEAIEKCKYYNQTNAIKCGKACMADPDHVKRCMSWYYETECKDFKEKNKWEDRD